MNKIFKSLNFLPSRERKFFKFSKSIELIIKDPCIFASRKYLLSGFNIVYDTNRQIFACVGRRDFFRRHFFANCTRSDDRSRIGCSGIEGVAVKGAVETAFTSGEEGRGGRRRSCNVEGICRRWRLPHSTGRRNISRTTCVDPDSLIFWSPPLPPAALCPSVSPLITGDYTRLCVSQCDNMWLQIDRCACVEIRDLKETACYDNELLLLQCNLHYSTESHVRASVMRIRCNSFLKSYL